MALETPGSFEAHRDASSPARGSRLSKSPRCLHASWVISIPKVIPMFGWTRCSPKCRWEYMPGAQGGGSRGGELLRGAHEQFRQTDRRRPVWSGARQADRHAEADAAGVERGVARFSSEQQVRHSAPVRACWRLAESGGPLAWSQSL